MKVENFEAAVHLYGKAIELNPANAVYFCNRYCQACLGAAPAVSHPGGRDRLLDRRLLSAPTVPSACSVGQAVAVRTAGSVELGGTSLYSDSEPRK